MEIKLSILIPSTKDREYMTLCLKEMICLNASVEQAEQFEIIIDWSGDIVGKKRNDLLKQAKGEYIVFVDSDDLVSPVYVSKILEACKSGADCIGINGIMTTNGQLEQKWFISKEYGYWHQRGSVFYRTTNHISPVRRELALQAGFPEWIFGEDAEYSRRLLPLLKTEVIITEPLYHYKFVPNK